MGLGLGRFSMNISLLEWPTDEDWLAVKQRCLVTVGKKKVVNPPSMEWKQKILGARHSPLRRLRFSFFLEDIPYFVSTHLARHIHAQPYIKSQRNDRQSEYDRNKAPQDAKVDMIYDLGGEEMLILANKRLCNLADKTTKEIVQMMCWLVEQKCPEFKGLLVPMCEHHGGVCHEMHPCRKCKNDE